MARAVLPILYISDNARGRCDGSASTERVVSPHAPSSVAMDVGDANDVVGDVNGTEWDDVGASMLTRMWCASRGDVGAVAE